MAVRSQRRKHLCFFVFFPLSLSLCSPDGAHSDESTPDASQAIYAEFDDDFEDEELTAPIGKCTAMYNFPGMSQGRFSRLLDPPHR